jgi:predicted PurR-regulated permease PerM
MSDPKPSPYLSLDPHIRRVVLTIGYMIIGAGAILAMSLAWPAIAATIEVLLPFLAALVAAYILNPIVTFLAERLRLGRVAALGVFYLGVAIVAGAFLAYVLPLLYGQARSAVKGIIETAPVLFTKAMDSLGMEPQELWARIEEELAAHGLTFTELLGQVARSEGVQSAARSAAGGGVEAARGLVLFVISMVGSVIGSLTFLVFTLLISFYFIVDFASFRGILEVMIPDEHEERVFGVLDRCDKAVGGFLRGQLISAVLVGLLVFGGLLALGLGRYALLIAMIAVVGNLIPYLGPILAGAPAVLYQLFSGVHGDFGDSLPWALGTAAMFIVVQQIDGFVFQPRIVGKAAQLHPVAVLLALLAGANFGILGMIVAVPAAAVIRVLLKEFYWDRREAEWKRTTGKNSLDDVRRTETLEPGKA